MKRKWLALALAVVTAMSTAVLPGCGGKGNQTEKKEQNAYEKTQAMLMNMKTYKSNARVEYKSNRGVTVYETTHACKITGEYRIEVTLPESVTGSTTIFDGQTISQFNPRIEGKLSVGLKEDSERSELFITSFIKNYLKSQEVSISVANFGEGRCTVLEATIPGNHPYLSTEKLWVDNDTLKPVQLIVYDSDGVERIIVTYENFEYNVTLKDDLFKYQ